MSDEPRKIDRREFLRLSARTVMGGSFGALLLGGRTRAGAQYIDGCQTHCVNEIECPKEGGGGGCGDCSCEVTCECDTARYHAAVNAVDGAADKTSLLNATIADVESEFPGSVDRSCQELGPKVDGANSAGSRSYDLDEKRVQMVYRRQEQLHARTQTEGARKVAPTTGDPVQISSGTLLLSSCDLSLPWAGGAIEVRRVYRSSAVHAASLGCGWNSLFDVRLVACEEEGIEEREVAVEEAYAAATASLQRHRAFFGEIVVVVNRAEDRAREIAGQVDALERSIDQAAQKARLLVNVYLTMRVESMRRELEKTPDGIKARGQRFVKRAQRLRMQLVEAEEAIERLTETCRILASRLVTVREHAEYARTIRARHARYVRSRFPSDETLHGNGHFLFVDEQGVAHHFSCQRPPLYRSEVRHDDQTLNYFPHGADCLPTDPGDHRSLTVHPDGHYTVTSRDAHRWNFDRWGRLISIADRNGATVTLQYEQGYPHAICDPFGKTLSVRWRNGQIVSITGPQGRSVYYSYQAGLLRGVTDPDGDATSYLYDGERVVRIVKPDSSCREYTYAKIDERWRVIETRDEEGHRERFLYQNHLRQTRYTTASGSWEVHHYDEAFRTVRIDYPDASSLRISYDEGGNVLERIDELGRRTTCEYDGRGNCTAQTDSAGHTRRWRYNRWNEVEYRQDGNGAITNVHYDEHGNARAVFLPDRSEERYRYNEFGVISERVDFRGGRWFYTYDRYGHLSSVTDPLGGVTEMSTSPWGEVLSTTNAAGKRWRVEYTSTGRPTRTVDPCGKESVQRYSSRKDVIERSDRCGARTRYHYDRCHLVTEVIHPDDRVSRFRYRPDGTLLERDENGFATLCYSYDARDRVTEITQRELQLSERFAYNEAGEMTSYIDRGGQRYLYGYHSTGTLSWIRTPSGHSRTYDYDGERRLIASTDENGHTTRWEYSPIGELTAEIDPSGARTVYRWENRHRRRVVIDRCGVERVVTLDVVGRVVQEQDGVGNVLVNHYDAVGNLVSWRDRCGGEHRASYDEVGRVAQLIDPEGRRRTHVYDGEGRLLCERNAADDERWYHYDGAGHCVRIVDEEGKEQHLEYDSLGMVSRILDRCGCVTSVERDQLGRVVAITDPCGAKTIYTHDPRGYQSSVTTADGRLIRWEYDSEGFLRYEIDNGGGRHSYRYDKAGNLIAEEDARGLVRTYRYDERNFLVEESDPMGNTTRLERDREGRIIARIDAVGKRYLSTWSANGEVIARNYPDGSCDRYTYDQEGRLTGARNAHSEQHFTYDRSGLLVHARAARLGVEVGITYDRVGRLASRRLSDGRTIGYRYSARGQIAAVATSDGQEIRFSYDGEGRELTREYPNGVRTERHYDGCGRLERVVHTLHSHRQIPRMIGGEGYIYDRGGRRIYAVDHRGGIIRYRYDTVGRLSEVATSTECDLTPFVERELRYAGGVSERIGHTRLSYTAFLAPHHSLDTILRQRYTEIVGAYKKRLLTQKQINIEKYTYDEAGNRTLVANGLSNLPARYDAINALQALGRRTYERDAHGNLVREECNGEVTEYRYTANDRVSFQGVRKPLSAHGSEREEGVNAASLHFGYDALGRRVWREERAADGSCRRWRYLYMGRSPELIGEWLEVHARSSIQTEGYKEYASPTGKFRAPEPARVEFSALIAEHVFVHGEPLYTTDLAVAPAFGATQERKRYYMTDGCRSVRATVDERGEVIDRIEYNPFGVANHPSREPALGEVPPRSSLVFGYTGKAHDTISGLVNYGFRDYHPHTAAYTSQDPVRDRHNWFAYVGGDPINRIDRWGLRAKHPSKSMTEEDSAAYYRMYKHDPSMKKSARNTLLTQDDPSLFHIPYMRTDGCNLRVYQAAAEDYVGRTLRPEQIHYIVKMAQRELKSLRKDLYVNNADAIMNNTFEVLGRPDITATVGGVIKGKDPDYQRVRAKTGSGGDHNVLNILKKNETFDPASSRPKLHDRELIPIYVHDPKRRKRCEN